MVGLSKIPCPRAAALEVMLREELLRKERRFGESDMASMKAAASLAECLCKHGNHSDASRIVEQLRDRTVALQTMRAQTPALYRQVWWDSDATLLTDAHRIATARTAAVDHDVLRAFSDRLSLIDTMVNEHGRSRSRSPSPVRSRSRSQSPALSTPSAAA